MPRSLAFCCDQMNDNLGLLRRTYGEETEAIRMGAATDRDRLSRPIQSIFDRGLHEFITDFLRAHAALARTLERDYRFEEKGSVHRPADVDVWSNRAQARKRRRRHITD